MRVLVDRRIACQRCGALVEVAGRPDAPCPTKDCLGVLWFYEASTPPSLLPGWVLGVESGVWPPPPTEPTE